MSTHCNIFALRFLFVGAPFFSPECALFRWSPLYFERHSAAPARWSTGRLIKNISLKFKSASQTSSQTTKILFPDCLSRGSDALQIALPPKICAGLGSIPDPYRTCYYTVVHTCVHKKVLGHLQVMTAICTADGDRQEKLAGVSTIGRDKFASKESISRVLGVGDPPEWFLR